MSAQAIADLKVQIARLAVDIKTAIGTITNPSSDDADITTATQQLSTLADQLEATAAPVAPAPAPGP